MAIVIGDRLVGRGETPYVIAEAAIQHQGHLQKAQGVARRAKRAGADAVKFQMFLPNEDLFCPVEGDEKRWPRWERSYMKPLRWAKLEAYCRAIGIDFLCSAFQHSAIRLLNEIGVKAFKVASRAAKNFPYDTVRQPKIVSMGMDYPGCPPIGSLYLQCRSEYPHKPEMWTRGEGLSDHSGSPWPSIHAMSRGAGVIEVHVSFYKDKDESASVTPSQLAMICDARDCFASMRPD